MNKFIVLTFFFLGFMPLVTDLHACDEASATINSTTDNMNTTYTINIEVCIEFNGLEGAADWFQIAFSGGTFTTVNNSYIPETVTTSSGDDYEGSLTGGDTAVRWTTGEIFPGHNSQTFCNTFDIIVNGLPTMVTVNYHDNYPSADCVETLTIPVASGPCISLVDNGCGTGSTPTYSWTLTIPPAALAVTISPADFLTNPPANFSVTEISPGVYDIVATDPDADGPAIAGPVSISQFDTGNFCLEAYAIGIDCALNNCPGCVPSPPCADVGTFTVSIDGATQSDCSTYDLPSGSIINFATNGDYTLPPEASGIYPSGIGFAIFGCDPSGYDLTDPATYTNATCFLDMDSDPDQNFDANESNCAGFSGTDNSWPSQVWVVAVTLDYDCNTGGFGCGWNLDDNSDGCVDASCIMSINYDPVQTAPVGCGEIFTDSGGAGGDYCGFENSEFLVCSGSSSPVTVSFTEFDVEGGGTCYDALTVYDAATAVNEIPDSPLCGTSLPASITSTNASGCLLFVFTSDEFVQEAGWVATVDCGCGTTVTPTFDPLGPYCQNASPDILSSNSLEGITGSWDGPVDTSFDGITTYTFTPDNPAQCAVETTMDIEILQEQNPTFDQLGPYCQNTAPDVLPASSLEGITGNWDGPIDTSSDGFFTYTFTPDDPAQCAVETTMDITVYMELTPAFDQLGPYCQNAAPDALPTSSLIGITGTWDGPIDTSSDGIFTYTFTPGDPAQCAIQTTMDVEVLLEQTPTFDPLGPYCQNGAPDALQGTSLEGITGSWDGPIDTGADGIFTYTFSPDDPAQCAIQTTMDVEVVLEQTPTFDPLGPYCQNATPDALQGTSLEGITGSWDGPIDTGADGIFTYTFSPDDPAQCAIQTTMDVEVVLEQTPTFDPLGPYCQNGAPDALQGTSLEGITGSWDGPIDTGADGIFTYTFSPDDPAQCAIQTTMDVEVLLQQTPTFDPLGPYCQNAAPDALQGSSLEGITGSWDGPIDTGADGIFTYTFSPDDPAQCAIQTTMDVEVVLEQTPTFDPLGPYCQNGAPDALQNTSLEGITGSWDGPIDTGADGIFTYTFSPDDPAQCAIQTTMDVEVLLQQTPTFDPLGPYCQNAAPDALQGSSLEGITGSWDGPIDTGADGIFTYTFSPDDPAQCAIQTTMDVEVLLEQTPTFDPLGPYCQNITPDALQGTSLEGITGNWDGPIDTGADGIFTYTFSPDDPAQCAIQTTMDIEVLLEQSPTFDPLGPYCQNAAPDALQNTSLEGITGSWDGPIDTGADGIFTYTFSPDDPAQCAIQTTMDVEVVLEQTPTFDPLGPYCQNATPDALQGASLEGITGSWDGPIDTGADGIFTYTFSPDDPAQCAIQTTMDVEVVLEQTPTFDPLGPYCQNAAPDALQGTSLEGITGSWDGPIDTGADGIFTYTFSPDDPAQCAIQTTMDVEVIPEIIVTTDNISMPECSGGDNGSATLSASGGNPAYTFSWPVPAGFTGATNNMLPEGNYTVTVSDLTNCEATIIVTITEPEVLMLSCSPTTNASGPAATDGSATIDISGGTPPYFYNWEPDFGSGTSNTPGSVLIENLAPDNYSLTVTDNNGCEQICSFTISTDACALTVDIQETVSLICFGDTNGALMANVQNATGNITYTWSDLSIGNTDNPSGLGSGNYAVTVQDESGCQNSASITLNEPTALIFVTITDTPETCFNFGDGTLNIEVAGGTPPFSYSLDCNDFQNDNSFTNLTCGDYTICARDANNCEITQDVNIACAQELLITAIETTPETCNPGSNGSITITTTGETGAVLYTVDGSSQNNNTFNNLPCGNYSIMVMDANGCEAIGSTEITCPAVLTVVSLNTICDDNGTSSDPSDDSYEIIFDLISTNGGIGYFINGNGPFPYGSTEMVTVPADDATPFNILFSDADDPGCTTTQDVPVPSCSSDCALSVTENTTGSCNDAGTPTDPLDDFFEVTLNAEAVNGAGQYEIFDGADLLGSNNYGTATTIILTADGNSITLDIRDASNPGCTEQFITSSASCSDQCVPVDPTFDPLGPYCQNTSPDVLPATSLEGITGSWDGPIDTGADGIFTYTFSPDDPAQCAIQTTMDVEVIPEIIIATDNISMPECSGDNNGSATLSASGGNPAYTFSWPVPAGFTGATNNMLPEGNYTVTVSDLTNCEATIIVTINEPEVLILSCSPTTNASGPAATDGSATIDISGGTPPYFYNWEPDFGSGTSNTPGSVLIENLAPDNYSLTVTDNNGCEQICSFTISTDACALTVDIQETVSLICFGDTNGALMANVQNATGNITYTWSDLSIGNTDNPSGLGSGNYAVTVQDESGCQNSASITLNEPTALIFVTITDTPETCFNFGDGTLNIEVAGGTPPFSYSLDCTDFQNDNIFTNLTCGDYTICARDANNCEITQDVNIACAQELLITAIETTPETCNPGSNGSITITTTGETGAVLYTVDGSSQNNNTFNNLPCGNYSIMVMDANGCEAIGSTEITCPAVLTVVSLNTICDDNGTSSDPSDDSYEIIFDLISTNGGTGYFINGNGPFPYGSTEMVTVPADDATPFNILFSDADDPGCTTTQDVPVPSCSSDCALSVTENTTGSCNDAGTPTDPLDDFFEVTLNAEAVNGAGQYEIFDGADLLGSNNYGTATTIILTADGNSITLDIRDASNPGCTEQIITSSASCSDACVLSIIMSATGACDDNGTPTDPTDDTFSVTVNATALNPGPSGQYTVTDNGVVYGPFDYGSPNTITGLPVGNQLVCIVADVDNPDCFDTFDVSQVPCSNQCVLDVNFTTSACDDGGTNTDPSDDTFCIDLIVNIENNISTTYTVIDNGTISGTFNYGELVTICGLPADGSLVNCIIEDELDPACTETFMVSQNSCSGACQLDVSFMESPCDNNGTGSDPTDDFYFVDINVVPTNPGPTGMCIISWGNVTLPAEPYGIPVELQLPADGSTIVVTISDFDNPDCTAQFETSSSPCSSECILTIIDAQPGTCNDNGTPSDPSDDTFGVFVNATSLNGGTTFTVSDATGAQGTFPYNLGGTITGMPANGLDINLTFTDEFDPLCQDIIMVSQESCSDLCVLDVNVVQGPCNDNGTPADPSDDTFEVTINATALNPGASGQFIVIDNGITYGPFTYGTPNVITGLPANGFPLVCQVIDEDNPNCFDQFEVSSQPCSFDCELLISATGQQCDDNGTSADPSDDTFCVSMVVDILQTGSISNCFVVTDAMGNNFGTYSYGQTVDVCQIPATGNTVQLLFTDCEDPTCITTAEFSNTSCSDECMLTIEQFFTESCSDNDTPADSSDDFFAVTFALSQQNGSGEYIVTNEAGTVLGQFPYGISQTISNLPTDIIVTLTFTDSINPDCSTTESVFEPPCSFPCSIQVENVFNDSCEDNNTPSDSSDDTFCIEFNIDAMNPGAAGTFMIDAAGSQYGPFIYGQSNEICGLPADGTTINCIVSDSEKTTCTNNFNVSQTPCSNACFINIVIADPGPCSNNSTPQDSSDDTFSLILNVTVSNGGPSGQYTLTGNGIDYGTFNYTMVGIIPGFPADGTIISCIIADVDDPSCIQTFEVSSPSCSNLCTLNSFLNAGLCDDGETNTDPSDDSFCINFNISIINSTSTAYDVDLDGTIYGPYSYDQDQSICGIAADGSIHSAVIIDVLNASCTQTLLFFQNPCSDDCELDINFVENACNNNGTDTDPADDFYEVAINVVPVNPGPSGMYIISFPGNTFPPEPYGTSSAITFPADGSSVTVTVRDFDNLDCFTTFETSSNSCSDACELLVAATSQTCDNGGTPSDPLDDTFCVALTVAAINSGGTTYVVTENGIELGTFPYDVEQSVCGISADGSTHTLTFRDTTDPACVTFVEFSNAACSNECVLTILQAFSGPCNDSGTPTDPSDDTFDVIVTANAVNGSGQFNISDNGITYGPFEYGVSNIIPGLPANGQLITCIATDFDDPDCMASFEVVQNSCSDECELTISATGQTCDDAGTPSDPIDDTFCIELTVSAINGGGTEYEVTENGSSLGIFPYDIQQSVCGISADGVTHALTFTDTSDPGCITFAEFSNASCSDACELIIVQAQTGPCNDNGTPTDPSDDTFDVTVSATALNPGPSGQFTVSDNGITYGPFDYDVSNIIPGLPANGQLMTCIATDVDDPDCMASFEVVQNSCSDECELTISATGQTCDDAGTPSDPIDDTFCIELTVSAINGGGTEYEVTENGSSLGIFLYDIQQSVCGITADGITHALTFTDTSDPGCITFAEFSNASCSDECELIIVQAQTGPCNDNGTPTDPSDDTFDVTVSATALNPGPSGQFTVSDNGITYGPFDYDVSNIIPGLPANGQLMTCIATDVDDPDCMASFEVVQNSCSDECELNISATGQTCDDAGTPSDPIDDTFCIELTVSAINGGGTEYEVTENGSSLGIFPYDIQQSVCGITADGVTHALTFTDTSDPGCITFAEFSNASCSDACELIIVQAQTGPCNDNGTPTDPSDDTFDVTVSATALNPGPSGQFTVSDNGITYGPFDYGVSNLIPGLPANGQLMTCIATDVDDPDCMASFEVVQNSCSDECELTISATGQTCDDAGTPSDPIDDTFCIELTVSAINGGGTEYAVTENGSSLGIFAYDIQQSVCGITADGVTHALTFTDTSDPGCITFAEFSNASCSDACELIILQAINGPCNDNGTPTDSSDDTFDVMINATALNPGPSGQFIVTDNGIIYGPFDYGVGGVITGLPANGIPMNCEVMDADDPTCIAFFEAVQNPCSDDCILEVSFAQNDCNDNGTNADPADDTFIVNIIVIPTNPGPSGMCMITVNGNPSSIEPYGAPVDLELPADGSSYTVTISDVDIPDCTETFTVSGESCSDECVLLVENFITNLCDNQETGLDPSDDLFSVTATASALNGNGAYTITASTGQTATFNYGTEGTLDGLPADGNNIVITISDIGDPACSTEEIVSQNSCSSDCQVTISGSNQGTCNDNGTPLDPLDDFFEYGFFVDALNPGAAGQFIVTVNGNNYGTFLYAEAVSIPDLPANGSLNVITVSDIDIQGCADQVEVGSDPCSDQCELQIAEAIAGACNDNGTPTDPSDDTFEVSINATAINGGTAYMVSDNLGNIFGPFTSGVPATIPGFTSGVPLTLTFTAVDNPDCSALTDFNEPGCSDLCVLEITETVTGACNDNGTLSDPSDDFFEVTITANAINPGASGQYMIDDNGSISGPHAYGVQIVMTFVPDGTIHTLVLSDVEDPLCSNSILVSQEPCDECNVFADAGTDLTLTCSQPAVTLQGDGTPGAMISWTGPDDFNSDMLNPQVAISGTYILTISLPGDCSATSSVAVNADNTLPFADAGEDTFISCDQPCVTLSANTGTVDLAWTGPGGFTSTEASFEVCTPGAYQLVATNPLTGCISSPSTVMVADSTDVPFAVIQVVGEDNIDCFTTQVALNGGNSTSGPNIEYQWLSEDGEFTSTDYAITVTQGGTYTFEVIDVVTGCSSATATTIIDFTNYPGANINVPTEINCIEQFSMLVAEPDINSADIVYSWSTQNGNITSSADQASVMVDAAGIYTVEIQDISNGCISNETVTVVANTVPPVADAGVGSFLDCMESTAQVDGTASTLTNTVFTWTGPMIISGQDNSRAVVGAAGTYSLTVTNLENGCTATDDVLIQTPELPLAEFSISEPVCNGESNGAILIDTVSGGIPPYLFGIDGSSLFSSNTIQFLTAGVHNVIVQDASGCEVESEVLVTEPPQLLLELGDDITIELGETVNLLAQTFFQDTLLWLQDTTTLSCLDCYNPVASPLENTFYEAMAIDTNGCSVTDEILISVFKNYDLFVPNTFSPNNDGINDLVTVYANEELIKINTFRIFDRWGEQVFENNNFLPNNTLQGWDGTLKGKLLNPAVFVYYVKAEFIDGAFIELKGDITLLR